MDTMARTAIEAKIAAITVDPLAWARADEEKFLKTLGSGARYAKRDSEADLRETAARELERAKALLTEDNVEDPAPEPHDMARQMRANERARRAIENLDS
jgi:hypothetical protein